MLKFTLNHQFADQYPKPGSSHRTGGTVFGLCYALLSVLSSFAFILMRKR